MGILYNYNDKDTSRVDDLVTDARIKYNTAGFIRLVSFDQYLIGRLARDVVRGGHTSRVYEQFPRITLRFSDGIPNDIVDISGEKVLAEIKCLSGETEDDHAGMIQNPMTGEWSWF